MVGCADPDVMPEQTWFERSADGLTATIGCVNADVKWSVRCVDNVWLGYHANCTLGKPHFLTYLLTYLLTTRLYIPRRITPAAGCICVQRAYEFLWNFFGRQQ